jgi:Ni,Fe-hydrogenase maturation factor
MCKGEQFICSPFFVINIDMGSVKDLNNRIVQVSKNIIVDIPDKKNKIGSMYVYMGHDPKGYLFHTATAKDVFSEMEMDDNIEQIDEMVNIMLSFDEGTMTRTH